MAQDFGDDMGNALLNFVTRQTENYLRFGRGRERAFDWWQRHYKKEGNTPEQAKAMAEKQSSREQVVVPFGTSEEAAYYAQVCRENGTYAAAYTDKQGNGFLAFATWTVKTDTQTLTEQEDGTWKLTGQEGSGSGSADGGTSFVRNIEETYKADEVEVTDNGIDWSNAKKLPTASIDLAKVKAYAEENKDLLSCLVYKTAEFTPEKESGSIDMDYTFNSNDVIDRLSGETKNLVVFEVMFKGSIENASDETPVSIVASECDKDNEGQTVKLAPSTIGTTATDKSDGDHELMAGKDAVITDEVKYEGLIPGKGDYYEHYLFISLLFLFMSGMRLGEASALLWSDIDFTTGLCSITKTLYYHNQSDYKFTKPKTRAAIRSIYLDEDTLSELAAWRKVQRVVIPDCEFVLSYNGLPTTKTRLPRAMKKLADLAGVHRVRVHDLRHSHASLLINMGESPLLLKERLGHEKIQTTLGTYGHLYPNTNQAVAKKLTGILNYSEPKTSIANYTSNQHTADYHRA